ncbi:hypothetical protein QQS21_009705 [Conoideocrella luteorostrata]|uniref:DUF2241 domain-containing protein n=1 Tax=Conoideocrella luteorostrata TaxID=1105319 RepID=A0AAJ0CGF2_9HYPO|nr:hypothetical protein QQS21_009705 [Conoideocrella luteorostrata]
MSSPMNDPGETSLAKLLATLTTVHPTTFVFATLKSESDLPPLSEIQLFFKESEGATVITSLEYAQTNKLDYFFPSKMITLNVTSSLEAVGFMAVIATKLATKGMGVNPVSGFYHDHLFVPLGREDEAMQTLTELVDEE